jgi:hypothetical protein
MKNVKWYSNKLKESFFFNNVSVGEIQSKKKGFGTPVIVIDSKTNISSEYTSISKAARSLNTYPKAIWRKVQNKQSYKGRYLIIAKYSYRSYQIYSNIIYKLLKNNYIIICYILSYILLSIIMYNYFFYMVLICKYLYYSYNIDIISINNYENFFEDKFLLNNAKQDIFNNTKTSLISQQINGLHDFNQKWKSECILKNNNLFITSNTNNKIGIYQSIISQINLDFNTKTSFPTINSSNPSPIIERININNIFSNAITATRNTSNDIIYNSLELQTQGLHGNRNYVVVDGILMGHRPRASELLNYQSNILYCIINGLSPSTY